MIHNLKDEVYNTNTVEAPKWTEKFSQTEALFLKIITLGRIDKIRIHLSDVTLGMYDEVKTIAMMTN